MCIRDRCDENHPIILESMKFPEPVIRVAIEPKTKAGNEKMGIALAKLAEEDPTFKTYTDEETGQTIIAGMGELHLEIIVAVSYTHLDVYKRQVFPCAVRVLPPRQCRAADFEKSPVIIETTRV